jgi:hypothetical protein
MSDDYPYPSARRLCRKWLSGTIPQPGETVTAAEREQRRQRDRELLRAQAAEQQDAPAQRSKMGRQIPRDEQQQRAAVRGA